MTEPGAVQFDLYQDVVMEHKRSPRNFGELPGAARRARGHNPSCGDNIQVALNLEGERIRDIRFTGQGCAICIASTSMMSEAVRGREAAFARDLQQRFRGVLTGETEPEAAQLGKLISLAAVRRYPSRIKCALLGWHALMRALDDAPAAASATTSAAVNTVSTEGAAERPGAAA